MNTKTLHEKAMALHRSGQLAEAERLYRDVLAADPHDFAARHLLGVVHAQQRRNQDALTELDAALALRPDDADAHLNRANVLKVTGRAQDALAGYARALELKPGWPQAENNRGTVLRDLGHYQEALAAYDRALAATPDYAEALNNRGIVLQDLKRPAEALEAYDQALRRAPNFAAAFNNRGSVLLEMRRFGDALSCFDRALALRPGDVEVINNRGNALQGLARHEEALAAYDRALAIKPGHVSTLNNRGGALQQLKRYEEALDSFEKAGSPEAFGGAAMAALNLCDWDRADRIAPEMEQRIRAGGIVPPWVLLGYSGDEALQRQCAANAIAKRFPYLPPPLATTSYRHDRIRLAYISSDVGHHPVATHIVQLIESHDRSRFDVIGVGTNADDGSAQRKRLVTAFDRFIDAHGQAPFAVAQQLRALEVDILVDLNGHTRDDNFDVLSHRPATVQAGWLGYAGTTAAPFVDYIIADGIVAPDARAFREKLALLPCYFPNDNRRAIGPAPSRAEAGLPELPSGSLGNAFVFCCFNANWKVTRPVFAIWMRLLAQVPGSVLWLKQPGEKAKANLLAAAGAAGIDPSRLIFAGSAALAQHLARHQLADLFLDTLPYNAHATGCDALWAGLPLLTQRGTAFAGRVCASLLTALDLPELITETAPNYEAAALDLARNPERLRALRARLTANRATSVLFETPHLARGIEALYQQMLAAAV
ncbi:MAG TPA: tetratricopeptide repeat protein [Rhizomicrobium sp.]|jgi:predicted O-linked N-acetylglucosamine transferase (SPINDLY family)|nr:tetratricopeptide repeat protein [Rhizomicrobium sp.]